jgi:hypothetical protein
MLRFAFHTPLKPLDHPTPSGDRAMARALAGLLERQGHGVLRVDSHATAVPSPRLTPESLPVLRTAAQKRADAMVERWSRLSPVDPTRDPADGLAHIPSLVQTAGLAGPCRQSRA